MGACLSTKQDDPTSKAVPIAPVTRGPAGTAAAVTAAPAVTGSAPTAPAAAAARITRSETVLPGDLLKRNYDLVKKLGQGAYATVYEGLEKSTGKMYAVKIIDLTKLDMDQDRWMLENEVEILRHMHHPNITSLHQVYRTSKMLALVMGLCRGGELFDEIVKRGKYSEEDARHLVVQLVDAVGYLHEHGVVHRDIKPENLLLVNKSPDSPLQLTDFGLSGIAKHSDMTMFVGTPQYMAPEVIQGREYGPPVDMWSIGVVTFVLLGGYLPFDADDERTLFSLINSGRPAYNLDATHWSNISALAKDFLSKLFVVDPSRRMTARQALEHPWLKNVAPDTHLGSAVTNLQKYNARRRLKAAFHTARFIARMAKVGSGFGSAGPVTEREGTEDMLPPDSSRSEAVTARAEATAL